MAVKYNTRSPAVKRLMREAIELKDPAFLYTAQPLEDNLFEWHFTIRGPPGSDYEGGVYHGRIILPVDYPMKPPSIALLTPNGRFEMGQKICLSASSYHPELWQPSWGIRTMLLALIGFMPTDGLGTIGSLECLPEERRRLAQRSLNWTCPACGSCNNSALPDKGEGQGEGPEDQEQVSKEMEEIVSQMTIKSEAEVEAELKARKQHDQSPKLVQPVTPNSAPRQRRPAQEPSTAPPTTKSTPPISKAATPTTNTPPHNSTASLLLIVMVMMAITLLLLRRLFMSGAAAMD